jgi:hypothetical protein
MTTVNVPSVLQPALQTNQVIRNSSYPSTAVQSFFQQQTNFILRHRAKEVASFASGIDDIALGGFTGTQSNWRFAYRSSSHARHMFVDFVMAMGYKGSSDDPFCSMLLENGAGTDIGTATFHYGATDEDIPDQLSTFGSSRQAVKSGGVIVELAPDTEYFGTFSSTDGGRLVSATVYEVSLDPDTDNGYCTSGVAISSPVMDEDRELVVTNLRDAWKHNAAPLWHWASAVDSAAPTRTTATSRNWIDQTLGAGGVIASDPAVTLVQLPKLSTVRRVTVPCKWWVHAKLASGVGPATVTLVGQTAGVVATIGVVTATAAWYSADVDLDAVSDRYALHMTGDGVVAMTLYASSLYMYEA